MLLRSQVSLFFASVVIPAITLKSSPEKPRVEMAGTLSKLGQIHSPIKMAAITTRGFSGEDFNVIATLELLFIYRKCCIFLYTVEYNGTKSLLITINI
jgi:hypothetical protein